MRINIICNDKNKILIKELFLYGIIGGLSASIDGILFGIILTSGINMYVANFVSVNIGIMTSFILNTYFNFKVKDSIKRRLLTFFAVGYIGMLISTFMLYVGNDMLGLNGILVKVISVLVVAIIQFVLNKLITYRKETNNG